ncbi:MAG: OadG family protein [Prolixibacteraceae bacterium]|nr:OadG family protein [Prolixibacteraceae bacterium]
MNSNFEIALELLGMGMLTVFLILFLVVFIGYALIRIVNRFIPAEEAVVSFQRTDEQQIPAGKMAAIVAAVQNVTLGKGHVVKIEKM